MLGRVRRTSAIDVGLALGFSGLAYLIWCLVAGTARAMVRDVIRASYAADIHLPAFTRAVKVFFVDTGFVIDLVGLGWLLVSLVLVVTAARQRASISWSWASAISQVLVAALGGVLVGYAMNLPYRRLAGPVAGPGPTIPETISKLSLPVVLTVSILVWVTCLIWLLAERGRGKRRGPTLVDSLRTNLFR